MRAGFDGISVLSAHPLIGLLVFLVVGAGVISVLSEGKLLEALGQLFRVFLTVFTTPFVFLRDALGTIRRSGEEEQAYARTRVFMLFRYSRIQYLIILIAALLLLSGGITASLVSLYPQAEMQAHRSLSEEITRIRGEIAKTQAVVAQSADPAHRATLEKARTDAKAAFDEQARATGAFLNSTSFSGGIINQLARAQSVDDVTRIAGGIDQYMADCPGGYSWQGFTAENCGTFRTFVAELSQRKLREQQAAATYRDADQAWALVNDSAANAEATLAALNDQLSASQAARNQISLFNPSVIGGKLFRALTMLLGTFASVIVLVWLWAMLIDLLNWIILLMRAAEKENLAKLESSGEQA